MDDLTQEQKEKLRHEIANQAAKLIGLPYDLGAEWVDYSKPPESLDCSELIEGVYKITGLRMEDGSQNQFNFTVPVVSPQLSDLVFFGKNGDPSKIYHVGLIYNLGLVIEARAFDPAAKFETGVVIVRPLEKWKAYRNYCGARSHPKLV